MMVQIKNLNYSFFRSKLVNICPNGATVLVDKEEVESNKLLADIFFKQTFNLALLQTRLDPRMKCFSAYIHYLHC